MPDANETRTTITGKPLSYQHDHLGSLTLGDGGGFIADNAAGANLLPRGYTDRSIVHIPIKESDIEPTPIKEEQTKKKAGFLRKLSGPFSDKSAEAGDLKIVMMTRGDYLKYWAKGEDGHFLPSVQEPAEGRKEWVRKQLELNQEWKKENPTLGAAGNRTGFSSGAATMTAAAESLGSA